MHLTDVGDLLVWNVVKLYLSSGTRLTFVYRSPNDQLNFIVKSAETRPQIRRGASFCATRGRLTTLVDWICKRSKRSLESRGRRKHSTRGQTEQYYP